MIIGREKVHVCNTMEYFNPRERAVVDMFVRYRNVCHLSRMLSEFFPLHHFTSRHVSSLTGEGGGCVHKLQA